MVFHFQDLNCLMERYLKPLQKEIFLTQEEVYYLLFVGQNNNKKDTIDLCVYF